MNEWLLECIGLEKTYGGVRALKGATLEVAETGVHGLVGHNGAGKSTLIKIVAGLTTADAGSIRLGGEEVRIANRRDAIRNGIVSVPQEATILSGMSVAENVCLGDEPRTGPWVSWSSMRKRAEETLASLGVDVPAKAIVDELSPSRQRMVMIATALSRPCRVLILDEPTAALGVDEAEPLLRLIERLPERGVTVLYISHRLDEVTRLCDRVTVMRDGLVIETLGRGEFESRDLVKRMVDELPEPEPRTAAVEVGDVVLRLRGLRAGAMRDVDLDIAEGAVTGVTGLVGSGAEELLQVVVGAARPTAGSVELRGAEVSFRSPANALAAGIGYVAGSRALAGLLSLTVRENVLASSYGKTSRAGFTWSRPERRRANTFLERLGLQGRSEDALGTLSGGNQQKVILSRLLAADAAVLVVNDPTAGVDARARAELHGLLRAAAARGCAVLVRCSEPEELIDLADVVHVMAGGRIVRTFDPGRTEVAALLEAAASSGASV